MEAHSRRRYKIGIDVGGTFTDLALVDLQSPRVVYHKVPSTPGEPARAVETGIGGVLERAGISAGEVECVVHGTTIGLNAIIQRRGARVALVVSRGNLDILELARLRMTGSSFDMNALREEPLVPRELVFEIDARQRVDGTVDRHPSQGDIEALVDSLKDARVEAVAVCLLNSYRHPELEADLAHQLRERLPGVLVNASAEVWPEIREYERAQLTTLSAYIHPLTEAYYMDLRRRVTGLGIDAPIFITTNNGGTISLDTAREKPADTILSGPASGVVASCQIAAREGAEKFITFDMGGTSSDMAVTIGVRPEVSTKTMIGDFPFMMPVVNVSAIGAGGGSIIWVDNQGVLKVGPESAGALPGPVCYGRGGTRPTVTDAYLTLGWLRADGFLGGRMTLDADAARSALEQIGARIGLSGSDVAARVAEAALRIATAKMGAEVHRGFAQRGLDPREFALVAYGGAGPTHACLLATEVSMDRMLVPISPGTLCAYGAAVSDLKRDFVKSFRDTVTRDNAVSLTAAVAGLEAEAEEWRRREGRVADRSVGNWSAEMRYVSEGVGLTIELDNDAISALDVEAIAAAFHVAHEKIYGFRDASAQVVLLSLHLQVVIPSTQPADDVDASGASVPSSASTRSVFLDGAWRTVDIRERAGLVPGQSFAGPALVEQEDTTVVLLDGWSGLVHRDRTLEIRRLPL